MLRKTESSARAEISWIPHPNPNTLIFCYLWHFRGLMSIRNRTRVTSSLSSQPMSTDELKIQQEEYINELEEI